MKFCEFYDEGWAARCQDKPYNQKATIDWKDGWKDCDELDDIERVKGLETLQSAGNTQ